MKNFQALEKCAAQTSKHWKFRTRVAVALLFASSLSIAADDMAKIPGGEFVPLQKNEAKIRVAPFLLEKVPVTNRQFLDFVRENPQWKKSAVRKIFADEAYLKSWPRDDDFGGAENANRPVTYVSWFAARAFATWAGKRLPSAAEWEFAAAASERAADGRGDTNFVADILAWYARPMSETIPPVGSTFTNFYGIADLHGLVWEWVNDFNSALVTGESREDTGLNRGLFCGAGSAGFSDMRDYAAYMRFAFRSSLRGNYCIKNLGFRCAKSLEELR